jgi:hypothetical protein
MSATEPNVMRGMPSGGLASQRVPQRTQDQSMGSITKRLSADMRALSQAVARLLSDALGAVASLRRPGPAKLTINNIKLEFHSLAEFQFAIASRTEPPTQRVTDLEKLTLFQLRRMATDIRKLETRLSEVLVSSLEADISLGELMTQLEWKQFSSDHEWRAIFLALAASKGVAVDEHRRLALAKYMQYLGERQAVIQRIYATRGTDAERGRAQAEEAQVVAEHKHPLQETSIFDFTQIQVGGVTADDLWALPRGESIALTLSGSEEIDLLLGRYPFKLVPGDRTYLVDPNGIDYVLRPGRNTVGRSQSCDVMVDVEYREISRKHLVIDRIDAQTVALTDLSSHGTRVPASRVVGARPTTTDAQDRTMVGSSLVADA